MVSWEPMESRVYFLCDRNAARSPMAAALLRAAFPDRPWRVGSAGLAPDDVVDPMAAGALYESGLDITAHEPSSIAAETLDAGTLVIALTPAAFEAARELRRQYGFALEYWELPEIPAGEGPRESVMPAYRAVRDAIKSHIANRFGS